MLPLEETAAMPLKEAVAERLAVHRAKTGRQQQMEQSAPQPESRLSGRSAQVRAAVVERFAKSVSYREFLATEAERALREAEAAVEVATRSAEAVTAAQRQLLAELEQWSAVGMLGSVAQTDAAGQPVVLDTPGDMLGDSLGNGAAMELPASGLRVRMYEELGLLTGCAILKQPAALDALRDAGEAQALDDEILFRSAPEFAQHEVVPLAANLIEFPRQLVASRKTRPRLAEGPLLIEAEARAEAQLRIFEAEPSQVSSLVETVLPDWSTMVLGAPVATAPVVPERQMSFSMLPQAAAIGLRLMAGIVDGCIVLAVALAFVTAFAMTAHALPTGRVAATGGVVLVGVLAALYQALFFTLTDATPGMRYARIGLCSFSDENPTRAAMRRRALAMMLSAAPLGLGFLWAWLDEDGLGWHDRISRMYQRSY